jgi:hypothetical protein
MYTNPIPLYPYTSINLYTYNFHSEMGGLLDSISAATRMEFKVGGIKDGIGKCMSYHNNRHNYTPYTPYTAFTY